MADTRQRLRREEQRRAELGAQVAQVERARWEICGMPVLIVRKLCARCVCQQGRRCSCPFTVPVVAPIARVRLLGAL